MSQFHEHIHWLAAAVAAVALLAGTGGTAAAAASNLTSSGSTTKMTEYADGHWIPFTSAKPLSPAQWAVVDAYADFTTAAFAVFTTHSVAPLVTVVSAQSRVAKMFARDLAAGTNAGVLYTKGTVESVAIHSDWARLSLKLYYPGGRIMYYVSTWARPFDQAGSSQPSANNTTLASGQYAPWQFLGDMGALGSSTPGHYAAGRDHTQCGL